VLVFKKVWELLERDSLLPEGGRRPSFYEGVPKQSPGCSAVGASAGDVNPKTHRKWVWAFIDAIANLDDVVVSNLSVIVVFFVMTPCDSVDAPIRIRCPHTDPMLASVRKRNWNAGKNHLFSYPSSPPHRLRRHRHRSCSRAGWACTTCSTTAR
jgi:hypothetical protein